MELVKHDSIASILGTFWHFGENGMTFDDFLRSEGHAQTEDGEDVTFTGADEVAGHEARGFWGFCETEADPPRVHVWVGPNCDPADIMFFLGHEIGHATGECVPETGDELADEMAEQERADGYGAAAQRAYQWLKQLGL